MKRLAIIAGTLVLSAGAAVAEFHDGNWLLAQCTAHYPENPLKDMAEGLNCYAYIAGAYDAYQPALHEKLGCAPPPGVSGEQIHDVIVRFLQRNPEARHTSGAGLVMLAVVEAWCPSAKSHKPSVNIR
jgi:hypothetical protein